jgi:raffinose/stachyose/melibiose transport system permease protein
MEKKNLNKNDLIRFTGIEILLMSILFISFFMPMILVVFGSFLPLDVVLGKVRGFSNVFSFSIDNYIFVIQNTFIVQNIFNSIFFTAGTILLTLWSSFFIATKLVKINPMAKNIILGFILISLVIPMPFTLGVFYQWVEGFAWLAHSFRLIIFYTMISLPLCIYIYFRFLENVPQGVKESATMDGLNWFQRRKVIFLYVKPASFIVSVFCIVLIGNDFLISHTLNQSASNFNINQEIVRLMQVEQFNRVQMWSIFSILFVMVALITIFIKDRVFQNLDDEFRF